MWFSIRYRVGIWCLLVLYGAVVQAQAASTSSGATIDLDEAIERTLASNPSLLAFGYQIEAQQGLVEQSTLAPNPELGVMVENVLGGGDYSGLDGAETTLSLGWVLERGKRKHRATVARAGVSMLESEADIRRLDTIAETARLLLDCIANQERLTKAGEAVALSEQTVIAVRERVQAGRTPEADLARAEAGHARVRLIEEDLEHELLTSTHRLAAQWGVTQPDFERVAGDIYRLPDQEAFSNLLARIDQNPDLSRYLTERRLREVELHLAQAEARPDWRVSTGIRRFEQSDDQAFVAGITIPLAIRNRNEGRIAEARAQLSMTDADKASTRLKIETRLFALHQELQHSLHRAEVHRDEILPRVEKALMDTQRAYMSGRYGYQELQVVQAEVLEARTALVEASIDAHLHAIEIERLTGTAMPPRGARP